jgi:F-type H+-transporting ATPase subunit b
MDATFWATVSLVLFLALMVYIKVPGMVTRSLDERANKIRNELEEARKLREEAQQLLAEYQRKRKEAEAEAAGIVDAAKREAKALAADAKAKSEDYVTRRTAMAEQKIAQAERDAIAEVRSTAVDLAVEAARKVLGEKVDAKSAGAMFKSSLDAVRSKLN